MDDGTGCVISLLFSLEAVSKVQPLSAAPGTAVAALSGEPSQAV
jgi:hypothetical protein